MPFRPAWSRAAHLHRPEPMPGAAGLVRYRLYEGFRVWGLVGLGFSGFSGFRVWGLGLSVC